MILNTEETKLILLLRNMSAGEQLELQKIQDNKFRAWKRHWIDFNKLFIDVDKDLLDKN